MPSATRNDHPEFNEGLPLIDFAKYCHGNLEEQSECRRFLLQSLSSHGFARLNNCGMSNEDVDRCFQLVCVRVSREVAKLAQRSD